MRLRVSRAWWFRIRCRIHNRWLDLRGWMSGYCMATTWRENTEHGPTYAPGYDHWRCWLKRGHKTPHRFNNYTWDDSGDAGQHRYDPLPIRNADNTGWFDRLSHGAPPPWGKHHPVAPRGRARRMTAYANNRYGRRNRKPAPHVWQR